MKIDWSNWNIGGKIIFVSSCVAALSFLLPWVDIGLASRNGITQGAVLLGLLYVYPMLKLLKNQDMKKWLGILFGALSVLFTIIYISSKTLDVFGKTMNASSFGAHLFLITSVILIIGITKYQKVIEGENP